VWYLCLCICFAHRIKDQAPEAVVHETKLTTEIQSVDVCLMLNKLLTQQEQIIAVQQSLVSDLNSIKKHLGVQ